MRLSDCVVGIDYGTDSVRSIIAEAATGNILGSSVFFYPRWREGKYCRPEANQFRQHPLDYIEGLEHTIREALQQAPAGTAERVKAISVDTTGSTPVALNKAGVPLALTSDFEENPNAMFVLWKDHTAIQEAKEINELAARWQGPDYTRYVGGIYSSEWFWAKILHILREDPAIRGAAYSWAEHCDWIPFLLTGGTDVSGMKRSRCAAGHKAMWHEAFDGLPSDEFLTSLDPLLSGLRERLYRKTFTSDEVAGRISEAWAERLGLPTEVLVGVGAFDAHMGAVGGQIEPYHLSKVIGTSTCDILTAPVEEIGRQVVKGICGQVEGSVEPGMIGLEAGQSAFGDVYAWFTRLLLWPLEQILPESDVLTEEQKGKLLIEISDQLIPRLTEAASAIDPKESSVLALDWLNGRRTPDANQLLKGAMTGLNLGSDAPKIFRALIEATCYGAKSIVERFEQEGVAIQGIIALGGVAKKSPFIMQTMANVLNRPIKVAQSEQTCALGAAMFAATAGGIYRNINEAKAAMGQGFDAVYQPDAQYKEIYQRLYEKYKSFGQWIEKETEA